MNILSVVCLTTNVKPSHRFPGMLMDLIEFDFTVQHKPRKQNAIADMLSHFSRATFEPMATLHQLQEDDEECSSIKQQLLADSEGGSDFLILDNILYHCHPSGLNTTVVPSKLCQSILEIAYDNNVPPKSSQQTTLLVLAGSAQGSHCRHLFRRLCDAPQSTGA